VRSTTVWACPARSALAAAGFAVTVAIDATPDDPRCGRPSAPRGTRRAPRPPGAPRPLGPVPGLPGTCPCRPGAQRLVTPLQDRGELVGQDLIQQLDDPGIALHSHGLLYANNRIRARAQLHRPDAAATQPLESRPRGSVPKFLSARRRVWPPTTVGSRRQWPAADRCHCPGANWHAGRRDKCRGFSEPSWFPSGYLHLRRRQ